MNWLLFSFPGALITGGNVTTSDSVVIVTALAAQALRELGIPVPGVTQGALLYAGWQIATGNLLTGLAVMLAILIGCLSGASTAYSLGRFSNSDFLNKFGKYLKLTPDNLCKIKLKINRKAPLAIFLGRLVPAFMSPISFVAGMLRLRIGEYAAGIALSVVIWESFYVGLGAAGKQVFRIINLPWNLDPFPSLICILAGGILFRFGFIYLLNLKSRPLQSGFSRLVSFRRIKY